MHCREQQTKELNIFIEYMQHILIITTAYKYFVAAHGNNFDIDETRYGTKCV